MSSQRVVIGSNENWNSEVLMSQTPVLVDFWAAWCGPCRIVSPTIERFADKYKGKIKVVKVNVDENPELATKFDVMSIPTIILFEKGRPLDQQIGAAPPEVFEKMISRNLKF